MNYITLILLFISVVLNFYLVFKKKETKIQKDAVDIAGSATGMAKSMQKMVKTELSTLTDYKDLLLNKVNIEAEKKVQELFQLKLDEDSSKRELLMKHIHIGAEFSMSWINRYSTLSSFMLHRFTLASEYLIKIGHSNLENASIYSMYDLKDKELLRDHYPLFEISKERNEKAVEEYEKSSRVIEKVCNK
jgi:hypothetical protein